MIAITGAAGFIGSYIASGLSKHSELILIDDFSSEIKLANHQKLPAILRLGRSEAFAGLEEMALQISYVIHLGARTDTAEQDWSVFEELNLEYSKRIWDFCSREGIPLIYASSAATYGNGSLGFDDSLEASLNLAPLNPYGKSKHEFDLWVLSRKTSPPSWAGLKFFNVYGPNEYHKGRMASVIFHAFHQIRQNGNLKLFRSHKVEYKDGEQSRDFIYVKDILQVIEFLMGQRHVSDIFNLGTGQARSFNDLAAAVFHALDKELQIEYIDTPLDIRESYQYFTQAKMEKLLKLGYEREFHSLEAGILDYVRNFLIAEKYF